MADLTTLGTAALAAIADGDVHWAAEAIVSFDALLTHNGEWIVALAFIAAVYRVAMRVVERWSPPRRRNGDAPVTVNIPTINTPPPQSAGLPPTPLTNAPPTSAAPPPQ